MRTGIPASVWLSEPPEILETAGRRGNSLSCRSSHADRNTRLCMAE
nr:MAG TPA: hypothetical protein [Caudoviricetes sp.]